MMQSDTPGCDCTPSINAPLLQMLWLSFWLSLVSVPGSGFGSVSSPPDAALQQTTAVLFSSVPFSVLLALLHIIYWFVNLFVNKHTLIKKKTPHWLPLCHGLEAGCDTTFYMSQFYIYINIKLTINAFPRGLKGYCAKIFCINNCSNWTEVVFFKWSNAAFRALFQIEIRSNRCNVI